MKYKNIPNLWKTLSTPQKDAWKTLALNTPFVNVCGETYFEPAYRFFVRVNGELLPFGKKYLLANAPTNYNNQGRILTSWEEYLMQPYYPQKVLMTGFVSYTNFGLHIKTAPGFKTGLDETNFMTNIIWAAENDKDTIVETTALQIDKSWDPIADGSVIDVVTQLDGTALVGGEFTTAGRVGPPYIAKIKDDGVADTAFNAYLNNKVYVIHPLSDNNILIGGVFTLAAGYLRNYLIKTDNNGNIDPSFNANIDSPGNVTAIAVQSNGQILIGGGFFAMSGEYRNCMARLNTDGTLDTLFNPSVNSAIYDIIIQPNGKILIAGGFDYVGGQNKKRIARLNYDGTVDSTFDASANSVIDTMIMQNSNQILIGGNFTEVNGVNIKYMARLNTDGTLDTLFDPNPNQMVRDIKMQLDGKIIVGGNFTMMGLVIASKIARLSSDGTLDQTSNLQANNTVLCIAIQEDAKIIMGGDFTEVGIFTRTRLARWEPKSNQVHTGARHAYKFTLGRQQTCNPKNSQQFEKCLDATTTGRQITIVKRTVDLRNGTWNDEYIWALTVEP